MRCLAEPTRKYALLWVGTGRTDFPDHTYSKVEFTPWEQKSFDQNDTSIDQPHYNTPTIAHLDSIGRTVCTQAHMGFDANNDPILISTLVDLDMEGNEKSITDARNNKVMEYRYGIHGEKGYTQSMDAGKRWMFLAVDGKPIRTWDSRGHKLRAEFDALRRPTKQWLSKSGASETLVGFTEYGELATNSTNKNLLGKPWKIYDQSGLTENVQFDFKGNLLENKRQFVTAYSTAVDWNTSDLNALLNPEIFTTTTAFDALNRATSIITPSTDRIGQSEILPEYNEASLLEKVKVKPFGANVAASYVSNIDYNAKGQREKIVYGNGATTSYAYDEKTFRLTRLLTKRNSGAETLQDLNYTYDPVGNITQINDDAQQTVYFNGAVVNPTQKFQYDAQYRLLKATGREHVGNGSETETTSGNYPNAQSPMPADANALRNYTRNWEYDDVGNILSLIHNANNGNWTREYNYATTSNQLISTTVGQTTLPYTHNEHGSMSTMPHLSVMDWDFAERLSHVQKGNDHAYYTYDGSGQRVRKVVVKGGITEERLYLGGFEIFRKRVGNDLDFERATLHVMDDKKRIALVETKTVENGAVVANPTQVIRYQLDNHLGSASLELDESAAVVSYEEYYPYGDTSYQAGRSASEVSQKRYRYTGKEKDEESGLYYHGARYYACWLGRWTASDPAGMVDGVNLYMYVRGNPVKLHDPSGKNSSIDPHQLKVEESYLPERNDSIPEDVLKNSEYKPILEDGKYEIYQDQIELIKEYSWNDIDQCFDLAKDAANSAARLIDPNAMLNDKNTRIGDTWIGFPAAPKDQNSMTMKPKAVENMVGYAKAMIDKKMPVLIGVNIGKDYKINDGVTDHFLVLVGYEVKGGKIVAFTGIDNSTLLKARTVEFRVASDNSGIIKEKGSKSLMPQEFGYPEKHRYEIIQMRIWQESNPPDTTSTGGYIKEGSRAK